MFRSIPGVLRGAPREVYILHIYFLYTLTMNVKLCEKSASKPQNEGHAKYAQRHITARIYITAPANRLGLRGAEARRSATWPFALVGAQGHVTYVRFVICNCQYTKVRKVRSHIRITAC